MSNDKDIKDNEIEELDNKNENSVETSKNNIKKAKICLDFKSKRGCKFGDKCRFSHATPTPNNNKVSLDVKKQIIDNNNDEQIKEKDMKEMKPPSKASSSSTPSPSTASKVKTSSKVKSSSKTSPKSSSNSSFSNDKNEKDTRKDTRKDMKKDMENKEESLSLATSLSAVSPTLGKKYNSINDIKEFFPSKSNLYQPPTTAKPSSLYLKSSQPSFASSSTTTTTSDQPFYSNVDYLNRGNGKFNGNYGHGGGGYEIRPINDSFNNNNKKNGASNFVGNDIHHSSSSSSSYIPFTQDGYQENHYHDHAFNTDQTSKNVGAFGVNNVFLAPNSQQQQQHDKGHNVPPYNKNNNSNNNNIEQQSYNQQWDQQMNSTFYKQFY